MLSESRGIMLITLVAFMYFLVSLFFHLYPQNFIIKFFKYRAKSKEFYSQYPRVKAAQSCLTVCNPMDYTIHGILQARILEWVAFAFSRGSSQPRDRTQVSCIAGGFFNQLSQQRKTP